MKAILEFNGFQKIIDIDKPIQVLSYFYADIMPFVTFQKNNEGKEIIDQRKIYFILREQIGQFLLYKFEE